MLSKREKRKRVSGDEVIRKAALTCAVVAGGFCLVLSSILVLNYLLVVRLNPLDNPEMLQLRDELAKAAAPDPALIEQVRMMDLLARKAFFSSQEQLRTGGMLLLAGAIALIAALRLAAAFKPPAPIVEGEPPDRSYGLMRAHTREALTFAGAVWLLAALAAAYFTPMGFPATADASDAAVPVSETAAAPAEAPAAAYPDWEAVKQNWPSFRGPGGNGVAASAEAPLEWDLASGKNILWKTELTVPGTNSPVVWGDKVYLSAADQQSRVVFCFDANTGAQRWQCPVEKAPDPAGKPLKISEETTYAAPSMVVHGDRAFAIFADGQLACVGPDGAQVWMKSLGIPQNHYGHSSSLIAFENMLIVQYDQKKEGRVFALDIADGHEVWSTPRKAISWASPILVETAFGFQLALNDAEGIAAYDPRSGKALWEMQCLDAETASSPAYGADMFFAMNDMSVASGIRFQAGQAAPTPEIAWEWDEALPDIASPVATSKHLYIVTTMAVIACLDAASGEVVWVQEHEEGFHASPIVAGDRVYATDTTGTTLIFKADAPAYELLGTGTLGEDTVATPAFKGGRIYMRTKAHLVCIAAS